MFNRLILVLFLSFFMFFSCSSGECEDGLILDGRFFHLAGLASPGYGSCISEDECSTEVVDDVCVSNKDLGEECDSFYDCGKKTPFCLSEIPLDLGNYCTQTNCVHENNENGEECPKNYKCTELENPMTEEKAYLCLEEKKESENKDDDNEENDDDEGMFCHKESCETHEDCNCLADVCLLPGAPGAAETNICVIRGCDPEDSESCPEDETCHEVPDFVQSMMDDAETLCYETTD